VEFHHAYSKQKFVVRKQSDVLKDFIGKPIFFVVNCVPEEHHVGSIFYAFYQF